MERNTADPLLKVTNDCKDSISLKSLTDISNENKSNSDPLPSKNNDPILYLSLDDLIGGKRITYKDRDNNSPDG